MRLVRVTDPATNFGIELHPRLTVLSGLPAAFREALARTAAAIPRGLDPPLNGSVEVHGILMDLDQVNLALLELAQEIDVVLRADDLPGADLAVPAPEAVPPGVDPAVSDPAVAHAIDQVVKARAASAERAQFVEALRSDLQELVTARSALADQLERTRSDIDSFALAGLKVARDEFATLEAEMRAPEVVDRGPERREIELRLDEVITSADTVRREIQRLEAIDVTDVRAALANLGEAGAPLTEPLPAAMDLASAIRAVDQQLAGLRSRLAGARQQISELTSRRDAAHAELVAAERALRAPELDPALVEELERVHDEIFELDGRESKVGASRARRRLGELRTEEDALLTRLGFDTWAAYVMGVSSADAEAERNHRHEVAKATYEFAEDELARAAAQPSDEVSEVARLEAQRDDLIRSAIRLVGPDGADSMEIVERLEAERVPVAGPDDMPERVTSLRSALESTGVELPSRELGADELSSLAEGWLETMGALPARLEELRNQHLDMEHQIDALAAQLEAVPERETIERVVDEQDPNLVAARAKVAEGEQRLERHRAAVSAVADLQRRIDNAASRAEQLATAIQDAATAAEGAAAELADAQRLAVEAHGDAQRRAREATEALADQVRQQRAAIGVESVEWYVLARLAAQRSLSFVGSVPFVIDDAFVEWPTADLGDVLTRLERMSEVIQVVFLTDDVEIAEWARRLGADRAQVLALAPVGG